MVGLLEDWDGALVEIGIGPGDTLLLYSDGMTEARNAGGEEFGDARLAAALRAYRPLPVADLPRALVGEVEAFAAGAHEDDITLVAARGRLH